MTHYIKSAVWVIEYRILTLDSSFQYHLNLFTNHVAFGSVTTTATTPYDILIDYSAYAGSYGYLHTTFSPINGSDYSMNKIVVFVSCFGYYGTANPVIADVTTTVLNATHFYYHFVFGNAVYIDRYHINLVVFDQGQMEATGLFQMNYYHVNFTSTAGG